MNPPNTMQLRRITTVIAVLAGVGLVAGFVPRWQESKATLVDTRELAIPTVMVVSPGPSRATDGLVLPAEVQPWLQASIYARANGYVKRWLVDIGAHVEAGQLLAEIDTPEIDRELDQARAQLALASANLELAKQTDVRWRELLKTASVSEQEAAEKAAARETAAANVEAARANVHRLEETQAFQRVVAPFAGTVTVRNVDIGDLIVAGSGRELFHLAQTQKLRVYVRVPQSSSRGVRAGQFAQVMIAEMPGLVFTGTVVTTSEAVSQSSRTLLTQLEVANAEGQILIGSYAQVRLRDTNPDPPLTLPANALMFRTEGLQVGLVNSNDTVELRKIEVGRDFGQTVEILAGVGATDRVIVNPSDSLVNGAAVKVATK